MIRFRDEESDVRAVAVAVLAAISGVALRGHVPGGKLNPFAGAIGRSMALAIALAVLGIALFVVARPMAALIGERQKALAASGAHRAHGGPAGHPRPATGPGMKSFVVVGFCLALLAELAAMGLPDRGDAHALTGVAVGLVLLGMCSYLGIIADPPVSDVVPDDAGESLQNWVSRTEALIQWSDTTRSDWDRRVRPILARQFEMATKANQRRTTDPEAFQATGKMLFGADLWPWVDPDNVARRGVVRRGPGRRTLERILQCLEQV
jgi:hypothetical protein